MSIEKNKAVVLEFMSLAIKGASLSHLVTDDAMGWEALGGSGSAKDFFNVSKKHLNLLKPPMTQVITAVTAEEDRVAVEAKGHADLVDGRVYENDYHFLFRLRDGLICEFREHSNTALRVNVFGAQV